MFCLKHPTIAPLFRRDSRSNNKYRYCPTCESNRHKIYRDKYRLRYLLARAKKRTKHNVTIDEEYLITLYAAQDGLCALTKQKLIHANYSIDRIDSTKGYWKYNVQIILTDINKMKRDFPQDKFIQYCKEIARNN